MSVHPSLKRRKFRGKGRKNTGGKGWKSKCYPVGEGPKSKPSAATVVPFLPDHKY